VRSILGNVLVRFLLDCVAELSLIPSGRSPTSYKSINTLMAVLPLIAASQYPYHTNPVHVWLIVIQTRSDHTAALRIHIA
jgi:hypothetical protein